MTNTQRIPASELREGHMLPGVDNGYVFEVETGNGYLSYPSTGYGMATAMPDDTILVSFHDSEGNENYLLLSPEVMIDVTEGPVF
jgi:hypothetical protein